MVQDGELLLPYVRGRGCYCCGRTNRQRMKIREIEGREGYYKRFCILLYIPGQKYTIGNYCTDREEQGELLFCDQRGVASKRAHCEIVCDEKGGFWVTPLGKNPTFINQEKLDGKTRLKFGDNLTLGEIAVRRGRSRSSKKEDDLKNTNNVTFLFRERELRPEKFLESDAYRKVWIMRRNENEKVLTCVNKKSKKKKGGKNKNNVKPEPICEFVPGQNELILSHILSHLSYEELKDSARFVAKSWNSEAKKILKKRSSVTFDFECGYDQASESMRFMSFLEEMKDMQIPNWELVFPGFGVNDMFEEVDASTGKPGQKLLDDLFWFLEKTKQLVKMLKLGGKISSQFEYDIRVKVLEEVGGSLNQLDWSGRWEVGGPGSVIGNDPFPAISFKELKTLVISMEVLDDEGDPVKDYSALTWVSNFIARIQHIRSLRLECEIGLASLFLDSLSVFTNLEQITLHNVNPAAIGFLNKKLNRRLRKLELYKLVDFEEKYHFVAFEQLLQTHAPTLESLQFILPAVKENSVSIIRLPAFPNLKNLNIGRESISHSKNFSFTFPGHEEYVNYEKYFPSLQSLTLWPVGHGKYSPIERYYSCLDSANLWENHEKQLFPQFLEQAENLVENPQICKSLQELDIPFESDRIYTSIKKQLFSLKRAKQFAAMFPNVHNRWITKARLSRQTTNPVISDSDPPLPRRKSVRLRAKREKEAKMNGVAASTRQSTRKRLGMSTASAIRTKSRVLLVRKKM